MSTYQYYEFLAVDRLLTEDEQAQVRALSTRARITATSFVNEYHWGDFHGSPEQLMERYYDAHLYFTDWGARRLMLRLDRELLSPAVVEEYLIDESVDAWVTGGRIILDFTTEDYEGDFDLEHDPLPGLIGIRAELAAGDHRPLYLAWLAALTSGEEPPGLEDEDPEPPVPPGLAELSAPQRALCDYLRVDADLLHVAAQGSPPVGETGVGNGRLASWLEQIPAPEKDSLLTRVIRDEGARVQAELMRRFRHLHSANRPDRPRRPVAELLIGAVQRREERHQGMMAAHAAEMERQERAGELARERRLTEMAANQDAAWARVDALIATRKPHDYDHAVALLADLRTLAEREDRTDAFRTRMQALRTQHARKTSLLGRFDRAGL